MTAIDEQRLREWAHTAGSRAELWASLVNQTGCAAVAEIGVYRGDFAAHLLAECAGITAYYMIDPWRHLAGWNKPANKPDDVFERYFQETLDKTSAWAGKRIVLRGTTADVIDRVPDGSLDLAYVDGDHTLRGITIDLIRVFPKIRVGGWIGGDDFSPSIWQHPEMYEPTLVCPFAVFFAEAVASPIYALPRNQFLVEKTGAGFRFVDLTGRYATLELRHQLTRTTPEQPATGGRARRFLDRLRLIDAGER